MSKELKYNPTITELMVPFSDDEISERLMNPKKPESQYNPKFSYVDPDKYLYRLHAAFPGGFDLEIDNLLEGERGIRAIARFRATTPDGASYCTSAPIFEEWKRAADFFWNDDTKAFDRPNPDAGKLLNPDYTYSALDSAGTKAISRKLGLGLHLYSKTARKVGSNGTQQQTTSGSAPAPSGPWTGDQLIGGGGKFKHLPWNSPEVDDGYINFMVGKFPNGPAAKEKARRAAGNVAAGATQGASENVKQPAGQTEEDYGIAF
jgi:hypothetical protein